MKSSAGILLYKKHQNDIYFFLVHPGGPFWINKDIGAWSIPKGEIMPDEDPLERARIEFKEETGKEVAGEFKALHPIIQKGGKVVIAWALETDLDRSGFKSNFINIEWPPRSGKIMSIPEVDRWEWFPSYEAQHRINPAQVPFLIETLQIALLD